MGLLHAELRVLLRTKSSREQVERRDPGLRQRWGQGAGVLLGLDRSSLGDGYFRLGLHSNDWYVLRPVQCLLLELCVVATSPPCLPTTPYLRGDNVLSPRITLEEDPGEKLSPC